MNIYPKINTIYKRNEAGQIIVGEWAVPEFELLRDIKWIWTEKIDGMNIRVALENGSASFFGRTDNAQLPPALIKALTELFPVECLSGLDDMTLYGEGYGSKIQNGAKYRNTPGFILFDIRVGDLWLERQTVSEIAAKIGIDCVPTLGEGDLKGATEWARYGIRSIFGEFLAEGLVLRPAVELKDRRGQRIIAKIKHRDFMSKRSEG